MTHVIIDLWLILISASYLYRLTQQVDHHTVYFVDIKLKVAPLQSLYCDITFVNLMSHPVNVKKLTLYVLFCT